MLTAQIHKVIYIMFALKQRIKIAKQANTRGFILLCYRQYIMVLSGHCVPNYYNYLLYRILYIPTR